MARATAKIQRLLPRFRRANSLHDFADADADDAFADAVSDDGQAPIAFIWEVPAAFRADRSFGVICEILQDAESYDGRTCSLSPSAPSYGQDDRSAADRMTGPRRFQGIRTRR